MRLLVMIAVFALCSTRVGLADPGRDEAWARGLAEVVGALDVPTVQRERRTSPRALAVRLLLPGLCVERTRFGERGAAARYAEQVGVEGGLPLFVEVRAEQVVVLAGTLVDERSAPELAARAWQVLSGPREEGHVRTSWAPAAPPCPAEPVASEAVASVVVIDLDGQSQRVLGPIGPTLYVEHHAALLERLDAAGARGVAFALPVSTGEVTAATRAFTAAARRVRLAVVVPENLAPNTGSDEHDRLMTTGEEERVREVSPFDLQSDYRLEAASADVQGEPRITRATDVLPGELIPPAEARTEAEWWRLTRAGDLWIPEEVVAAGAPERIESLVLSLLRRTGLATTDWLASSGLLEEFTIQAAYHPFRGTAGEVRQRGLRPEVADRSAMPTLRYSDVLAGRVDPRLLRGALVFVGTSDARLCPRVERPCPERAPEVRDLPVVYVHAFAARRVLRALAAE